jgi:hypothetical protein
VKALVLNSSRASDEFSGAETSFKFKPRRGHPTRAAQDFELPEEFHFLARSSVSEGPDLSDHLDREMNSV